MVRLPIISRKPDVNQNLKYRLLLNGKVVSEFNKMAHAKQANGQRKRIKIVLEQATMIDTPFRRWIKEVSAKSKLGLTQKELRKNLILQVLDTDGKIMAAYKLEDCWVSEYTSLPMLNSDANAVEIQSVTLETEGWEREDSN
jgi:phage tail-like protein